MEQCSEISVAMATFNGEKYITEQIQSIVDQIHKPTEIVISDDRSTDNIIEKICKLAKNSRVPIRLLPPGPRLGYRSNFMRAAQACRSPLIAFSDQDDVWDRRKLKACTDAFVDPTVMLCYHNATCFETDGKLVGDLTAYGSTTPYFQIRRAQDRFFNSHGLTQVFRSDLLKFEFLRPLTIDHRSQEGAPLAHDQWIFFLASLLGEIRYLPECLVEYRQHEANTIGYDRTSRYRQIFSRLSNASPDMYERLSVDAEGRLSVVRALCHTLPQDGQRRAALAATDYMAASALFKLRSSIFRTEGLWDALVALSELIRRGGYANSSAGFGHRAFLKDMVVLLASNKRKNPSSRSSMPCTRGFGSAKGFPDQDSSKVRAHDVANS